MDTEYIGMVAAITFLLLLVVIGVSIQLNSIEEAADFGNQPVGATILAEGAALHLMNHEDSERFGTFEKSEFKSLTEDCGEEIKGVKERSGDKVERLIKTGENGCSLNLNPSSQPVLVGIETLEGGDSDYSKSIIQ